jgi:FKBP-type peptidyl-prolyl cis-trans isomerase
MRAFATALLAGFVSAMAAAAVGGEPPQDVGLTDPAVTATTQSSNSAATALPAFPLAAYSALGSSLVQSGHFGELGWNDAEFNALLDGMRAAFQGRGFPMDKVSQRLATETSRRITELAAQRREQADGTIDPKERLARYFKHMRKSLELQISNSGLGYNVEPATQNGVRARPGDTIVITCKATAADGVTKLPQLSTERIRVKMEGMMPGLMEGLQMLTVGSQAVFVIPPSLSFGEGTWPDGVQRGAPLVYTVTLHDVIAARASP